MVKRQRIRKPDTCSGVWPAPSSEEASFASGALVAAGWTAPWRQPERSLRMPWASRPDGLQLARLPRGSEWRWLWQWLQAHSAVPPLLVGMVIVGFGTSAPELVVSAIAATQGNPALAVGNAWGSNIVNMGLILGVTALIAPIQVRSVVLRKELPLLMAVTALSALLAWDLTLSRANALVLPHVLQVTKRAVATALLLALNPKSSKPVPRY